MTDPDEILPPARDGGSCRKIYARAINPDPAEILPPCETEPDMVYSRQEQTEVRKLVGEMSRHIKGLTTAFEKLAEKLNS